MYFARFHPDIEDVPFMDSPPMEGECPLHLSDDDPIILHELEHVDHMHVWVKWSPVTLQGELVFLQ